MTGSSKFRLRIIPMQFSSLFRVKTMRIIKITNDTSFSNPYIASPTSQLIFQYFRRFTYVTARSTTLPLLHLRHRYFTYVPAHSPTLSPLHLRHSSFYNPSIASSTSQLSLQPFRRLTYVTGHFTTLRCFTYVTGTSRTSPGEPLMHRGMKNSLWWTSLLQQVAKFRSSYSFG